MEMFDVFRRNTTTSSDYFHVLVHPAFDEIIAISGRIQIRPQRLGCLGIRGLTIGVSTQRDSFRFQCLTQSIVPANRFQSLCDSLGFGAIDQDGKDCADIE